jgi:hypothetical protein
VRTKPDPAVVHEEAPSYGRHDGRRSLCCAICVRVWDSCPSSLRLCTSHHLRALLHSDASWTRGSALQRKDYDDKVLKLATFVQQILQLSAQYSPAQS